tara:strand:+ start:1142 stop:1399 length:258 start_codon:yes stop_codon:yes gene_type:complete
MSKEALMKFREEVMADDGLQQECRELMFEGPDRRRRAGKYLREKGLAFSLPEFFDFLENPGDDVELHELELDFVVGGQAGASGGC